MWVYQVVSKMRMGWHATDRGKQFKPKFTDPIELSHLFAYHTRSSLISSVYRGRSWANPADLKKVFPKHSKRMLKVR